VLRGLHSRIYRTNHKLLPARLSALSDITAVLVLRKPTKQVEQKQRSQLKHKPVLLRILQAVSAGLAAVCSAVRYGRPQRRPENAQQSDLRLVVLAEFVWVGS